MATCVDLGNAEYPKQRNAIDIIPVQGRSLRPLLTGEGEFAARPLYWEHEGNAAIRVGDQKLVRLGMGGNWELFDLKADRTEQHDLAGTHSDEVNRLMMQWQSWAKSANVIPKPQPKKNPRKGKSKGKRSKAKT